MLIPLRDNDRRLFVALSLALSLGSASLLPLTAQSALDGGVTETALAAPVVPRIPGALTFPEIKVARDPFVPLPAVSDARENLAPTQTADIILPPNAGAEQMPGLSVAGEAGTPVVRAVVLGPQSRALIEDGGSVKVLGVGDALGNATISAIDSTGIELSTGTRLLLTEQHP